MDPDRLFELLVDLEQRLEALREEICKADPPQLADEDGLTSHADRRALARQLRGVEKGITSAARSARDARRALAPYATPRVREDERVDPSDDVEP